MTNDQLIKHHNYRKSKEVSVKYYEQQIKTYSEKRDAIKDVLDLVNEIDEIFKDVPISMWEHGSSVNIARVLDPNIKGYKRSAKVWKNCHDNKTWSVGTEIVFKWDQYPKSNTYRGFKTKKRAIEHAKMFVCFKKEPKPLPKGSGTGYPF